MKTRMGLLGIMGVMLLAGCGQKPAALRWEYKVVEVENSYHASQAEAWKKNPVDYEHIEFCKEAPGTLPFTFNSLFELGADGWELAAAIPQTETVYGASKQPNMRTGWVHLIFKRQWRSGAADSR